jgi:hypothetical protein
MDLNIAKIAAEAGAKILRTKSAFSFLKADNQEALDKAVPDISTEYVEVMKHHFEVAVHAEKGYFPHHILRTKAPNQTPEEWNYQKGIYEPYTRSSWGRALNKTKIISNKQNYSITGWDDEQKEYFYGDYPDYHNIEAFFFDIVRPETINYPNKVLLIEPKRIPTKINSAGEEVADDSVMIDPVAVIVDEKDVIFYRENELTIFYIGTVNELPAFKAVDKSTFYKVIGQRGVNGESEYTVTPYYTHNWGYVPARRLGGKPVKKDNFIYYESFFSEAIPDLNGVIRLRSNLDMANYTNVFPVRIERVDFCTFQNAEGQSCTNGKIWNLNDGKWGSCPSCNGTGRANRHSPTGVKEVLQKDTALEGAQLGINDIVTFVSPPIDGIESIKKQADEKEYKAFAFIFRPADKTQVTVEGAMGEKEEAHSFYQQLANVVFNNMDFAIEGIGFMRFGADFVKPDITKPTSFNTLTSADITGEIESANTAKLPTSYRKQLILQSTETRFNSNEEAERYIKASMELDKIWGLDELTIRAYLGQTISPVDAIIHQRITTYLDMADGTVEGFWDLDRGAQFDIIKGYADEDYLQINTGQNNITADSILNNLGS